jgi:hypothetical protein
MLVGWARAKCAANSRPSRTTSPTSVRAHRRHAAVALTVSNPPTQAEVQALADKLDEPINTLQGWHSDRPQLELSLWRRLPALCLTRLR